MGSSINKKKEETNNSIEDDFKKKKQLIEEWNKNEERRSQLSRQQSECVDKKQQEQKEKQKEFNHSQSLPLQPIQAQTSPPHQSQHLVNGSGSKVEEEKQQQLYESFPSIIGSGGIKEQKKNQEEERDICQSLIMSSVQRNQDNLMNSTPTKQQDIVQSPKKQQSIKLDIQNNIQSETDLPTAKFRPSIGSEMHQSIFIPDSDNKKNIFNAHDQLENGNKFQESEVNTSRFNQLGNSQIKQQEIQNLQQQQGIQNSQQQQGIQIPQEQQEISKEFFSFQPQNQDNESNNDLKMFGTHKPGAFPPQQTENFGSVLIGESPTLQKLPYSNLNQLQIFAELPEWTKKMLILHQLYQPTETKQIESSKIEKIKQQGVLYEGNMQNGKKNGYGMHFINNEFYEGYFVDDERKGWGRLLTQNGELKSGQWEKNFIQKEMYFKTNTLTYEGQCRNSCPHGKGKLVREGEFTYEGTFSEGKLNGRGIRKNLKDNTQYEGEFLNDIIQGQGTYKFSNGKKYTGQFEKNMFQGKGEMFWPDGRYYKGQFHNNFRHGQGYYREADGSTYEGGWIEDKKNGMGKSIVNGLEIHGIWKNDEYQDE